MRPGTPSELPSSPPQPAAYGPSGTPPPSGPERHGDTPPGWRAPGVRLTVPVALAAVEIAGWAVATILVPSGAHGAYPWWLWWIYLTLAVAPMVGAVLTEHPRSTLIAWLTVAALAAGFPAVIVSIALYVSAARRRARDPRTTYPRWLRWTEAHPEWLGRAGLTDRVELSLRLDATAGQYVRSAIARVDAHLSLIPTMQDAWAYELLDELAAALAALDVIARGGTPVPPSSRTP